MANKKFLNDYKNVEILDKNGKIKMNLVYTGKYYSANLDKFVFNKYRILCLIMSVLILTFSVIMGLYNNAGSRIFYVIVPYAVNFLPTAFIISACWYIITSPMKMTYIQYTKSVIRFKNSSIAVIILISLSIVGDIIFMITNLPFERIDVIKEILYILTGITVTLVSFIFLKLQGKIKFNEDTSN